LSWLVALDKNVTPMTSQTLATDLGRARDQGIASAAFVIAARTAWILCLRFVHALLGGDDLPALIGANHGRRTRFTG
jgi:hypothetical protein